MCVRHKNESMYVWDTKTNVVTWHTSSNDKWLLSFLYVSNGLCAMTHLRHTQPILRDMRSSFEECAKVICVAEEWAKVICTTHITLGHSLNELRMSRKTGCVCLKWVMAHKWAAHVSNESWHTNGLRMSQMSHGTQPNWDMSHQMTRLLILNVSSESCLTYIFGHATHTLLICNTFKLVHETHCVSYTTHSNYTLSRVFV